MDDIEVGSNNSSGVNMAQVVEQFLQNLITCVNRDFIDQAAETFIMKMNRKSNRKKLVRTLFTVSRTRYGRFFILLAAAQMNDWVFKNQYLSKIR